MMEIGMDFSEALLCLKQEKKMARYSWNGKGQWVVMMPGLYLEAGLCNGRTRKHLGDNVPLDSQPYFVLKNAQDKWQPGWVPSTGDLLANDWYEVKGENG